MSRIIPVGYAEAAFVLEGVAAGPYVTTIGCSLIGISPTEYQDAADSLHDMYATTLLPYTASALSLTRVDLRVGLAGGTSGTVTSTNTPDPGGRSSASALLGLAPVVQKRTANLGRKGRGRAFVPAVLAEDDVANDGTIDNPVLENIQEAYSALILAMSTYPVGEALPAVLLHADETTPTLITNVTIASKAGIVRSRLR